MINKWFILIGTLALAIGLVSTILPTTIQNPSGKNIAITAGLMIIMFLGVFMFMKKPVSPSDNIIKNERLIPVD